MSCFGMTASRRPGAALGLVAYFAAFALAVLYFASQTVLSYALSGQPLPPLGRLMLPSLFEWGIWAALAPLVFVLARRWPIDPPRRARHAVAHLAAGLAVSSLKIVVDRFLLRSIHYPATPIPFARFYVYQIHPSLLTYFVLVGLHQARDYYRRYRDRELRALQLEARLAESRLESLRMQLHPHFLFNTLHAISTLMHRDVEAADRMLARLSELLRLALDSAGAHEVRLQQELEFLDGYLEIQQARFGGRLAVAMDIDSAALDVRVPNLILQPLVENAIRHGIAPRASGGALEISARRTDGRLRLAVRDDGPGLPAGGERLRLGVGLSNTRARLRAHFGEDHAFELANDPRGGLRVTLSIPAREADAAAAEAG
jgi:two-component system LytT family sensor kinase